MSQLVKYQDLKELSVAKIIESNTLPIALLKKEDAKSLQINLSAFMIEFSSIYKIDDSKNLSDEEIKTCVNILLTDYYWLKYEDFAMFLKNARMGKYGKIYDYNIRIQARPGNPDRRRALPHSRRHLSVANGARLENHGKNKIP